MARHVIHFGVAAAAGDTPAVMGHDNPSIEKEVYLPQAMHDDGVTACFISGSWGCWGPADQETEGDNTLHVCFATDRITAQRVANLHAFLVLSLEAEGRVLDHALISTDDWSDQTHVALIGGNPHVVICTIEGVLDSGGRDPQGDV